MLDLSGGQRSGVSDYGAQPKHVVLAENVEFRPFRMCRVRNGSQLVNDAELGKEPHTLMEWVAPGGTTNKYVCCKGAVNGNIHRITAGPLGAYTPQALPIALQPETWLSWDQLNGAIFVTENGGSSHPIFYRSTNTADTWLDCILPTPSATMTLTPGAGGSMVAGAASYYAYRLRWLYEDGSSVASTPQEVVMGVGNTQVAITTIPVSPAGRTDYIGWVLERTQNYTPAGTLLNGPFYYVASGTAALYTDTFADADLGYFSNDNWYGQIPNGHLDGFVALADRLIGWSGSTVYVSMPIAHDSGAGILNWNGREALDFGPQDGDWIRTVVKQNDRLMVLKLNSSWLLEGNDPSNFTPLPFMAGVGAYGLRSAASMGSIVVILGPSGLHRVVGNDIRPWGYIEVGNVIDNIPSARTSEVVVCAHRGQRFLISLADGSVPYNSRFLVHDERFRTWAEWTGWRAQDVLIPKVFDFGDADAIVIADPKDLNPLSSTEYGIWIANYGRKDERNTSGGGGNDVTVKLRTPWIDDGFPDEEKAFEWLQVYGGGSNVTINAHLETDRGDSAQIQLILPVTGKLWGSFTWADGTVWGQPTTDANEFSGAPVGTKGNRYRVTYTADVSDEFTFAGHAVRCIRQPGRRYSR